MMIRSLKFYRKIYTEFIRMDIKRIMMYPIDFVLGNMGFFLETISTLFVLYIIFFKINLMTVNSGLFLALLSLCFSWILSLIIGHIIGLLSPYLISINGTKSLVSGLILLLGGGVLPIDIYPAPLKLIVLKLPFVALQYFPSAILSGSQLFSYTTALLIQFCWILFFLLVLFIVQKRVYSKLEIMGG